MGLFKFYLQTFNDDGTYSGEFIEITEDVVTASQINQTIESSDYDVGVVRNNGFTITLRNDKGYYSDAENIRSYFNIKRKGCIVRVTWTNRPYFLQCGAFVCGEEFLGEEIVVFEGVINDVSASSNIEEQRVKITVFGYESVLNEITVPYSSITDGDLLSTTIWQCINQSPFSDLVTIDVLNINVGFDEQIDDKTSLENKTVGEALADLLLATNSVLYIKNNIVYVSSRNATDDLIFTFYGQATPRGIENILNIPVFKDGLNRVFNFWTWQGTTLKAENATTIDFFGIRKKEIGIEIITDDAKRNDILDTNNLEFSELKVELELHSPLNYETVDLNILDKVAIDYPTIPVASDANPLPRYSEAVYGENNYPFGQWSLTINESRRFKILGKKIDLIKEVIIFYLREV